MLPFGASGQVTPCFSGLSSSSTSRSPLQNRILPLPLLTKRQPGDPELTLPPVTQTCRKPGTQFFPGPRRCCASHHDKPATEQLFSASLFLHSRFQTKKKKKNTPKLHASILYIFPYSKHLLLLPEHHRSAQGELRPPRTLLPLAHALAGAHEPIPSPFLPPAPPRLYFTPA